MESTEKQEDTTGKQPEKTLILASADVNTAEKSKPAQTKKESDSTTIASILAVLQTDFYDLQSKGLRVVILARENKLYASIEFVGHSLDVRDTGEKVKKKSIFLDDKAVVEYE